MLCSSIHIGSAPSCDQRALWVQLTNPIHQLPDLPHPNLPLQQSPIRPILLILLHDPPIMPLAHRIRILASTPDLASDHVPDEDGGGAFFAGGNGPAGDVSLGEGAVEDVKVGRVREGGLAGCNRADDPGWAVIAWRFVRFAFVVEVCKTGISTMHSGLANSTFTLQPNDIALLHSAYHIDTLFPEDHLKQYLPPSPISSIACPGRRRLTNRKFAPLREPIRRSHLPHHHQDIHSRVLPVRWRVLQGRELGERV